MCEERVAAEKSVNQFCICKELHPCTCGHNPPYHCGVCCLELTAEQFAEAKKRGWYSDSDNNWAEAVSK